MARIAGVDLPREKRVEIALTYIYGIGRPTSSRILGETGVSPDTRVRDLSDAEVARLRQIIERSVKVEGALRTEDRDEHQAADGHRELPRASAIGGACRSAASGPTPTRGPRRVRGVPSPARRK